MKLKKNVYKVFNNKEEHSAQVLESQEFLKKGIFTNSLFYSYR